MQQSSIVDMHVCVGGGLYIFLNVDFLMQSLCSVFVLAILCCTLLRRDVILPQYQVIVLDNMFTGRQVYNVST